MKTYTAKTVEDAVNKACLDLGVTVDQLNYEVTLETPALPIKIELLLVLILQ